MGHVIYYFVWELSGVLVMFNFFWTTYFFSCIQPKLELG